MKGFGLLQYILVASNHEDHMVQYILTSEINVAQVLKLERAVIQKFLFRCNIELCVAKLNVLGEITTFFIQHMDLV